MVLWFLAAALVFFMAQRSIYQKYWGRRLRMSLRFGVPAAEEGEPVSILERVENRKRLPLPLASYRYTLCRNFTVLTAESRDYQLGYQLALPARRVVRNKTVIEGLPRGIYSFADGELGASDLFCTCKMSKPVSSIARMTVYPGKIPAEKLSLPVRRMMGTILTRRYAMEDPFQLRGIRPYESYDSMRFINWKASAKTGELKVNQFEFTTDEALLLLLDVGSGTEEERENLIRLASSLSQIFLRRGVCVALYANARSCVTSRQIHVPSGGGLPHQRVIDETLAQIRLSATAMQPFPDLLRQLDSSVMKANMPVVLSAEPTRQTMEAYAALCSTYGGYLLSTAATSEVKVPGIRVYGWDDGMKEVGA